MCLSTTEIAGAQVAPATAEELSTRGATRQPPLRIALDAGSTYQTNPRLLRADDPAGRTDNVGIAAEGAFRLGRTRMSIGGDARVYRSELRDLDHDAYGVRVTAVRRLQPRLSTALTVGTRSALAIELVGGGAPGVGASTLPSSTAVPPGGAQGVPGGGPLLLPTARVRFDDVRLAATSRVTAATSVDVAVLANRSAYNMPGLFGGAGWATESVLRRRLTARVMGNARLETASARSAAPNQPTSGITTLTVGPTWRVSRFTLRASGGASRVTQTRLNAVITSAANVAVERTWSRGYLTAFVDRRAAPSFGQEQVLVSTQAGLSASRAFTRSTIATLTVQQTRSTAPSGPKIRFASTTSDVALRQRVVGRAQLVASAFYRNREEALQVRDVGASLSMAVPLR